MTLEDCIEQFYALVTANMRTSPLNGWDYGFLRDINTITTANKRLSSAQCDVCCKIIKKHMRFLVKNGFNSTLLDAVVASPSFRTLPYQSVKKPRLVRWVGDNILIFKCSFNRAITDAIKQLTCTNYFVGNQQPRFNRRQTVWVVRVNESNIAKVMSVIKRHCFEFDSDVEQFLLHCENSRENREPCTAQLVDASIQVTVKCDDFFDSWLSDLIMMESVNV